MDEGMKAMDKICTSIEQSRKLIELGIDVNTADMRYGYIAPYDFSDRMYDGGYDEVPYPKDFLKKNPYFSENEYDGELPAWSLTALMELMPDKISIDNESYYLSFTKKSVEFRGPITWDGQKTKSFEMDNILDAAFEMVVWLKENGKL